MINVDKRIFILLLLLMGVTLTAACAAARQPGRIELGETEFDLGEISSTGPVSQTFQMRNAGQGTLEITGVSTSCGCTTAEVDRSRLGPGETATLTVTYDPQAHGGQMGRFTRVVYVRSDDPETPEANLTIRVTVTGP
ncbi:MAG TPA: DUF1573 domain-containing protein [Chloroflexi bacterium]|nr:DUF1573 domain-containing protein [Chloroflexota bacterium]